MHVAGRDHLLDDAVAALTGHEPGARAVLLEGEAGIGKSSVWGAVVERLAADGWRILATRPAAPDAGLAFIGLHDLLDGVADEVLGRLADPLGPTLEVALRRRAPGDEPIEPGAVAIAVLASLRELARERPVLVAVDDGQWLDASTSTVLGSALRRLRDERVAVLAARRSGSERTAGFDPRLVLPDVRTLAVPPLSLGALHHVLRLHLERTLARPALVRLHEVTAGNPYYAIELARSLTDADGPTLRIDARLPPDVGALLAGRLAPLSPPVRRLASAAGIAPRPTVALLAMVLDTDEGTVHEGLDALRIAGIAEERDGVVTFSHPLLARASAALEGDAGRRALHARMADADGDEVRSAYHLAASRAAPDSEVAARLEEVAAGATARGATLNALELLERSITLTPSDAADDLARRRVLAGEALFVTGDVPRARAVLERVLAGNPPDAARLEAALLLATITWFDGDSRVATELAEAALAATTDQAWRARFHSRLSWMYEHDLRQATSHARAAMSLLDKAAEPSTYAFALMNAAIGELGLGIAAHHDWIEEGAILQERAKVLDFSTLPANWAKTMDRFDEARSLAAAYRERSEAVGDDSSGPMWPIFVAELEGWAGNIDLGLRLATEGLVLAEQTRQPAFVSSALSRRAWLRAVRGDEGARDDAAEALRIGEAARSGPLIALAYAALGFLALSADDPVAADAAFSRADDVLQAAGDVIQPAFRFQADHVEALVRLGDLGRAAAINGRLEARGGLGPQPWAGAAALRGQALLASAQGDPAAGLRAAEASIEAFKTLELPFETARAWLVAGQIQRRLGQRRAAAASLGEASTRFAAIGASGWADRARADADRLGLRRSADAEALTPSEERIARMAATGLTNREVAARLVVSPKTVEANLARVYLKLGIRSRAELGSAMGTPRPDDGDRR